MVEVTVTFVGLIQRLAGRRQQSLLLPPHVNSLGDLLRELAICHGREMEERLLENGELSPQATVLINGRNALSQGGLAAKLSDGSQNQVEIVLLGPPLMGG